MNGDDNIRSLRTNRKPYEDLTTEHLRYCAEDVAQLFIRAHSDPDPEFFLTFARQLARVRRLQAVTLPADCAFMTGDMHPYTLAAMTDVNEFTAKCAVLSATRRVSLETSSGQCLVRQAILQNSSDAILQICRFISRHRGASFMEAFMTWDGAMALFKEDSGMIMTPDGIELHERVNRALAVIGLETYPDIVPPSGGSGRPPGPPKLTIV